MRPPVITRRLHSRWGDRTRTILEALSNDPDWAMSAGEIKAKLPRNSDGEAWLTDQEISRVLNQLLGSGRIERRQADRRAITGRSKIWVYWRTEKVEAKESVHY